MMLTRMPVMARTRLREFGEQLDALCEPRGIFKRDIARVMNVSNSYMSQVVKRGATPGQIEDITKALVELGVKIDGEPIQPTYFDIYSARRIVDEALHGDSIAIDLLNAYARYNQAGIKKRREIQNRIAELRDIVG